MHRVPLIFLVLAPLLMDSCTIRAIRRFLFRILTDHDKRSAANLTALSRQLDPSHRSKEITA